MSPIFSCNVGWDKMPRRDLRFVWLQFLQIVFFFFLKIRRIRKTLKTRLVHICFVVKNMENIGNTKFK